MRRLTLSWLAVIATALLIVAAAWPAAAARPLAITLTPSQVPPSPTSTVAVPSATPTSPTNTPTSPQAAPATSTKTNSSAPAATATATRTRAATTPTRTPTRVVPTPGPDAYLYAAKFVCGQQAPGTGDETPLKPGNYATAINLHNYTDHPVAVSLRPAVDYTLGAPTPRPAAATTVEIAPYSTLEVDCPTLLRLAGAAAGSPLRGMVGISLAEKLPVAVVYTAEITDRMDLTDTGAGISIDVEYLEPFNPR
ncbi:MAG: hypothetical protein IT317_24220 [Anaerolineales bacterium]|nr:hypothetical protein [Anaerolineales bacterium]